MKTTCENHDLKIELQNEKLNEENGEISMNLGCTKEKRIQKIIKFIRKEEIDYFLFTLAIKSKVDIDEVNGEIFISGSEDYVNLITNKIDDYLNERIIKELEMKITDARILYLHNIKFECEKEFENFKLKFQYDEDICIVILIGIRKNVVESETKIQNILKNVKRVLIKEFETVEDISYLKENNGELIKLMQMNDIICTFEIDNVNNFIFVNLVNENDYNQVIVLIDNLLKRDTVLTLKLDVQLFESRLFMMNNIEKSLKKKFNGLKVNRNKKYIELDGNHNDVNKSAEIIKRFLETIISEEFLYNDKSGIETIKNNEKDFVLSLSEFKILCVVSLNLEENLFVIHSIDGPSIDMCKNHIKEYIQNKK